MFLVTHQIGWIASTVWVTVKSTLLQGTWVSRKLFSSASNSLKCALAWARQLRCASLPIFACTRAAVLGKQETDQRSCEDLVPFASGQRGSSMSLHWGSLTPFRWLLCQLVPAFLQKSPVLMIDETVGRKSSYFPTRLWTLKPCPKSRCICCFTVTDITLPHSRCHACYCGDDSAWFLRSHVTPPRAFLRVGPFAELATSFRVILFKAFQFWSNIQTNFCGKHLPGG